jgi:hypothetical protein
MFPTRIAATSQSAPGGAPVPGCRWMHQPHDASPASPASIYGLDDSRRTGVRPRLARVPDNPHARSTTEAIAACGVCAPG